jgi:hypothetical protein
VGDPQVGSLPAEISADLEQAADVSGEHGLSIRFENIFCFALPEALGHFRFGEVVAAGGAAANLRFVQGNQFQARDHFQQLPGLLADLLAVAQMTGIMISSLYWQRMFGRHRS